MPKDTKVLGKDYLPWFARLKFWHEIGECGAAARLPVFAVGGVAVARIGPTAVSEPR